MYRRCELLERQVEEAQTQLEAARAALHAARIARAGIAVGEVVRPLGWNAKYGEIRVTSIQANGYERKPWIKGVARKKNGE